MSLPKVLAKNEWVLTQAAFDGFLAVLDRDRDKAGEKYESIRLKLLKYFQWCGSDVPDIDADETINRVTRRIDEGENVYNITGYIYGVAKLVNAESLKRRHRRQSLDEESVIELPWMESKVDAATYQECIERCLGCLSDKDREVITEYYRHKKTEKIESRKRLAARQRDYHSFTKLTELDQISTSARNSRDSRGLSRCLTNSKWSNHYI